MYQTLSEAVFTPDLVYVHNLVKYVLLLSTVIYKETEHREVKCLATFTVPVSDGARVGTSAVWVQAGWSQVMADESLLSHVLEETFKGVYGVGGGGLVCDCNSFVHSVLTLDTTQVVVRVGMDKEGGSLLSQCGDTGDTADRRVVSAMRTGHKFAQPSASG